MALESITNRLTGRATGIILAVAAIIVCATLYWAILGVRLDSTIRQYLAECEAHLVDPKAQKCVMTFIPTAR